MFEVRCRRSAPCAEQLEPDAGFSNVGLVGQSAGVEQVNVQQAKTHLSRLLARVEQGETILLARGGGAVARLEPVGGSGERELGFLAGPVPDSFFEPLPEDELERWEQPCVSSSTRMRCSGR